MLNSGWEVAAWKACAESHSATLTKRNSAAGERLRCNVVETEPSEVPPVVPPLSEPVPRTR